MSSGQFSVSKINQILSVFVAAVWLVLFVKSLLPVSVDLAPDTCKIAVLMLTLVFLGLLHKYGRSSNRYTLAGLHDRGERKEKNEA